MHRFRGIYRVVAEFDSEGVPNREAVNIRCYEGDFISRVDDVKAIYYCSSYTWGKNKYDKLLKLGVNCEFKGYNGESEIVFDLEDISKVEDVLNIVKKGKNVSPYSKRNKK